MLGSDSVKFNKQLIMQIQLALQFRHSINNKSWYVKNSLA